MVVVKKLSLQIDSPRAFHSGDNPVWQTVSRPTCRHSRNRKCLRRGFADRHAIVVAMVHFDQVAIFNTLEMDVGAFIA
jgi:hypothetical protein